MTARHVTAGSARYGFDAPGVMIGLLVGATAGLVFGLVFRSFFVSQILIWLSVLIFVVAGVIGTLGLSMLLYGLLGKLRVRDFMIQSLALKGNEHVLDIGTGRGLLGIGIAKKLDKGKVIGIDMWSAKDLTGNTIENTRANALAEGASDRFEVHTADATSLPFGDAIFDAVVSQFVIHNIEPETARRKACFEMARVLKPGGTILLGDYIPTHTYAKWLDEAGLKVTYSRNFVALALSLTWIVRATKV